jgi:aryl-alcohol dehydrogenase-like predicted oxidoreductase
MSHRYAWLAEWNNGLGNTLKRFREQGGAKYLGVSVYGADEALAAIEHPDMDIIQIPANAWDGRMVRAGVFDRAREQDKLLFVRSVFLQGLLLLSPEEAEAKVPGAGRSADVWAGLCRQYGCSSLELAVNWAMGLQCPLVIGAETPEQTGQISRILVSCNKGNIDVSFMEELERETIINPSLWGR